MREENPEAAYWNETGGERWVENIDRLEAMLAVMNRHLLERAAPQVGERVLDIGCGGGVTSAAFADAVGASGHVDGADISAVILDVARARYADRGNLNFIAADAGVHPFAPGTCDLITSRFGVMFFPEPTTAFANLLRAGRSGGRLVFLCWRSLPENPWMGEPAAAAFSILPRPEKPDPDAPGPFSLADPEKIQRILDAAGFRDITLTPIDEMLNLGEFAEALDFMTKMGPTAEPLKEAPPELRDTAIEAMRAAMAAHETPEGLIMPAATWLVEATIA
mgnify:FL=1